MFSPFSFPCLSFNSSVARNLVRHVKSSSTKGKAAMGHRQIAARQCAKVERHFTFIDPDDGVVKETTRHARNKLEIPMEAAMPCKLRTKKRPIKLWEYRQRNQRTQQHPENKAERSRRSHRGKGFNSQSHCNLVHQFVPSPQAMKNLDAKAAVDKEFEKLGKLPAWQLTKVKSKREDSGSTKRAKNSPFCYADGHLSSQKMRSWNRSIRSTEAVVLRGDMVKDDPGSHAVTTEQGSSASQMMAAKVMDVTARLPDCEGQAAGRSISSNSSNDGGRSKIAQNFEARVSI